MGTAPGISGIPLIFGISVVVDHYSTQISKDLSWQTFILSYPIQSEDQQNSSTDPDGVVMIDGL
jgi:hypothetical protein